MTYSMIAEKTKQEQSWHGPLDKPRNVTDPLAIVYLLVSVLVWLMVSVYAFVAGDVFLIHYSNTFRHKEMLELSSFLIENLLEAKYTIMTFVALTTLLLAGYVALFRWATKALLRVTIAAIGLSLVFDYVFIGYYVAYRDDWNYLYIVPDLLISVMLISLIWAFRKIGIDMVCKVIKESCKAIFHYPSTLLFAFGQFIINLLLIVYAVAIFEFLRAVKVPAVDYDPNNIIIHNDNTSNDNETTTPYYDEIEANAPFNGTTPLYVYAMHAINVFAFLWTSSFVAGLGRMALTCAFATWYYLKTDNEAGTAEVTTGINSEDKKEQKSVLVGCFVTVLRYHAGTVAYATSPLSSVPMFNIVRNYGRDTLAKIYKRPVLVVSWVSVLLKFTFDALAMCAIHGTNYYESAKNSYVMTMKNPMSYLAVNTVTEFLIFYGLLLAPLLSIGMSFLYFKLFLETELTTIQPTIFLTAALLTIIISILMSFTCFMVFRAASNTIRCCYLNDSKFNHEAEMKLYEIHVDDASVKDDVNGVTVIREDR